MTDYAAILVTHYPNTVWSLVGDSYEGIEWSLINEVEKPTKSELDALWNQTLVKIKKDNCKSKAKELLAKTDWSILPDVTFTNKSEFETYRATIREYISNPVENPTWPTEPDPIW